MYVNYVVKSQFFIRRWRPRGHAIKGTYRPESPTKLKCHAADETLERSKNGEINRSAKIKSKKKTR